ncbi:endolytic transglycosylase MltG [Streptomyces sp. NA04227]|uniref:endolytic transglycosylase MltG n=1 Tax=Streptomyces sp. NA04227 TaxID=2742136 RepID=UPI001590CE40|nr:endolytic transglycosylase MltG [Streptomyces sp. NA04227]QKW05504.1 endolytic transglycosylase MltG [Streptomyces sp. NA04227]
MTEYGRGPGPQPWHPEDPLYGDGYGTQQSSGGQPQYDGQSPQPYEDLNSGAQPHYGHQPYGQGHPQPGQPYDTGVQGPYGQQYDPGHQQYGGGQQPYDTGQQPYDTGQQSQYGAGQQPYQGEPYQGGQQYDGGGQYDGGWDTGTQQAQTYGSGGHPDPYGTHGHGHPAQPGQGGEHYGAEGYPQQAQPGGPQAQYGHPGPQGQQAPADPHRPEPNPRRGEPAEPPTDWDPGPDQGEHAFFSVDDADDADDEPTGRKRGRRGGGEEKKSRSGCSCMVAGALLLGLIGGGGYFGYQFYQDRFGPAPDYDGAGSGNVTVEIPQGATGYEMGKKLAAAGVVKSADAFVEAQGDNPDGMEIQHGFYTLKKQMSGENAVALMLDPKSRNALIIGEGRRNAAIYAEIDKRLGIKAGTTEGVAKKEWKKLGLPDWANKSSKIKDPLEGFLFPASYPVDKSMKPADVLKKMVDRANAEYANYDLEGKAKELDLKDPLQVVTVASLVQAEGMTHDDFRKMAAVVYNRLKPTNTVTNQKLEFDSTYNYVKNQSEIDIPVSQIRNYDNPYNTYFYRGLTPGPIGNPGKDALEAATSPDTEGWMFFISMDCRTTTFSKTLGEHQKYVDEFNKRRKEGKDCE